MARLRWSVNRVPVVHPQQQDRNHYRLPQGDSPISFLPHQIVPLRFYFVRSRFLPHQIVPLRIDFVRSPLIISGKLSYPRVGENARSCLTFRIVVHLMKPQKSLLGLFCTFGVQSLFILLHPIIIVSEIE